jgi:hypothetical protein
MEKEKPIESFKHERKKKRKTVFVLPEVLAICNCGSGLILTTRCFAFYVGS